MLICWCGGVLRLVAQPVEFGHHRGGKSPLHVALQGIAEPSRNHPGRPPGCDSLDQQLAAPRVPSSPWAATLWSAIPEPAALATTRSAPVHPPRRLSSVRGAARSFHYECARRASSAWIGCAATSFHWASRACRSTTAAVARSRARGMRIPMSTARTTPSATAASTGVRENTPARDSGRNARSAPRSRWSTGAWGGEAAASRVQRAGAPARGREAAEPERFAREAWARALRRRRPAPAGARRSAGGRGPPAGRQGTKRERAKRRRRRS